MTPSPLDDCLTGLTPWKDVGLDRKLGIPKLILVLSGLGCVTLVRLLNLPEDLGPQDLKYFLFQNEEFTRGHSPCIFEKVTQLIKMIFFFFVFLLFLLAAPSAYGGSQARGPIGAVANGPGQSHSNAGSKPRLQPTSQFMAMLDP